MLIEDNKYRKIFNSIGTILSSMENDWDEFLNVNIHHINPNVLFKDYLTFFCHIKKPKVEHWNKSYTISNFLK